MGGSNPQLDWKVGWTYNQNRTGNTDLIGFAIPNSISSTVSGDLDRSFISLPLKFFNTNLDNVNDKYTSMINANPSSDHVQRYRRHLSRDWKCFPGCQKYWFACTACQLVNSLGWIREY